MTVAFFTDSYFPGIDGVTYTLETWKKRLEERGHEVYIIYPKNQKYSPGKKEIPVRSLPNPFYRGYRIPFPILNPNIEPDIVHCHSPGPIGVSGLLYAWRENIPKVYTHHTPIEEYFEQSLISGIIARVLGKVYVPLENLFLKCFDLRTASIGSPERSPRFVELPVGVNLEFFKPSSEEFEEGLKRPLAGYSGRISKEKNPMRLLEMAERFDGTLLMIGEGPMRKKVEDNKPENVVNMDFLPRDGLPAFYSSIDVFVTASDGDTLGLSTLEANACGTPVVAPNVFPFKRTIGEENGVLYSAGSSDEMLEKLDEALSRDFDSRDAVKKYSISKAVEKLEKLYREVV